ncbi:hypothetical protein LJC39_04300, partial [Parabacteroides sp. OttesenSCG-928-B22]|nr:hypothetical protein [Parabacteroides sp. OttesenSCG-928-B22]
SLIPYYEEKDGVVLQKWEIRKNDVYLISQRIEEMKSHLSNDDYKIIKCYEANLLNNPLPYDIVELHSEREKIRKEINELEKLLL